MNDFQKKLEERRKLQEQERLTAIAEFKAFVSQNYPQAIGTPSGLYYVLTQKSNGELPRKLQQVTVHYTGKLSNGLVFDSSYKRNRPFSFQLGAGRVIQGWDEGIALLRKGESALLLIPYFLGYGLTGHPPVIPPKATLLFEVELLDFK